MLHPNRACNHADCAAAHATTVVAAAFNDKGPYTPDLTRAAAIVLVTAADYLRHCLGAARPAAVPDTDDLADLTLALHAAATVLGRGVAAAAIGTSRDTPAGRALFGDDPDRAAACRAGLLDSAMRLQGAADRLAETHCTLTPDDHRGQSRP